MPSPDDLLAQAKDPSTPLSDLHLLAQYHPELRAAIASNPSTYPALLEWLGALGDPEIDAALRARQAATPSTPAASLQAGAAGVGLSSGAPAVLGDDAHSAVVDDPHHPDQSGIAHGHDEQVNTPDLNNQAPTEQNPQPAAVTAEQQVIEHNAQAQGFEQPATVEGPDTHVSAQSPMSDDAQPHEYGEHPTVVQDADAPQETVVMTTGVFADPHAEGGPVPAGQWNRPDSGEYSPQAVPAGQWEHTADVATSAPGVTSAPVAGSAPDVTSGPMAQSAPGIASAPVAGSAPGTQPAPASVASSGASAAVAGGAATLAQATEWNGGHLPPGQPTAGEEKKSNKTLLWIILAALVIIAAVIIGGLFAFLGHSEQSSTESAPAPAAAPSQSAQSTTDQSTAEPSEQAKEEPTPSPTPSPTPTNKPTVAPAPADAVTMDSFTMPSGNITCHLSETQATCTIAQHNFTAQGPGCTSSAAPFSAGIAEEGTATGDCNTAFSQVGTTLNYGSSAKNGSMVCTASEDGARCWSQVTGQGFFINRDSASSLTR